MCNVRYAHRAKSLHCDSIESKFIMLRRSKVLKDGIPSYEVSFHEVSNSDFLDPLNVSDFALSNILDTGATHLLSDTSLDSNKLNFVDQFNNL